MKTIKILGSLIVVQVLLVGGYFVYQDKETIQLNDEVRASLAGSFAKTSLGVVHYELVGHKDAELVVLVHGFSVPSYLWQPTFEFLESEGYRVLRFSNSSPENELKVEGWGEKFANQAKYKGFRRAILFSLRYFSSNKLLTEYELLAKTDLPKLLVWGTEDQTVPYAESEILVELMPDMHFEPIEGAGHIPSIEKPDVFNQVLLSFLRQE